MTQMTECNESIIKSAKVQMFSAELPQNK